MFVSFPWESKQTGLNCSDDSDEKKNNCLTGGGVEGGDGSGDGVCGGDDTGEFPHSGISHNSVLPLRSDRGSKLAKDKLLGVVDGEQ